MPQGFNWAAFGVFAAFVAFVLGISFYLGSRAKSAKGYFAAHGQVGWFVNGIAFAGDYLSAASFLGICGMIAVFGYDGFLYSIGFLAGWVVALFVIAEPIKRLGKYTFADALDSKFNSRGIKLSAAISTLVVSLFYLIPQMVGAGSLIKPLLGFEHWVGVLIVGVVVILIVVTAGMVSTTWVQFIKGSLLVVFCLVLTVMILRRGLVAHPEAATVRTMTVAKSGQGDPKPVIDGRVVESALPIGTITKLPGGQSETGPLGPLEYIATIQNSEMVKWKLVGSDDKTNTYEAVANRPQQAGAAADAAPERLTGSDFLVPGVNPLFAGVRTDNFWKKLDFLSLMIALFAGTASLPHILIRYYTVKDGDAARKSTVVGIASIGFFYILTLYLGLGAMTTIGPVGDSNMAAPLLAQRFGNLLFAIISAIAFTTVLGTVSGLIMAASGAVAHDLMTNFMKIRLDDHGKVKAAKVAAAVVGVIAMGLGILFERFNATFLVGWAFNVAASANLPALVMLLFWRRTTKQGITAAIVVGLLASLGWLLLSGPAFQNIYGREGHPGVVPFSQPGIVTIPLGFLVLIVVSLLTPAREDAPRGAFRPVGTAD